MEKHLWIFDFDGTVSDIVPKRDDARLNPECARMIEALAQRPGDRVAILSSRTLEDLIARARPPGVYLGGNNGLLWQFPDGRRREKGTDEEELGQCREFLLPQIDVLKRYPGVEIEDKGWSISVHFRRAPAEVKKEIELILDDIGPFRHYKKMPGPEVMELQLLDHADKGFGIRNLCEFLGYEPEPGGLVYAGDSDNDIPAMQWVLFVKGTVFTVGEHPLVDGSRLAASPGELARSILKFASPAPRRVSSR